MFEDDRQRASWRRHGAIARGVAKRGLVAFLAFVMAFGTTPAQLWAEGAEGIAEAVAQAATSGEGAAADDGVTSDADVTAADDAAENVAIGDDATAGDTASAEGSAAPASVDSEQGDASDSVAAASARSAYVAVDSVEIVDADGNGLAYGSGTAKVGDTVKVAAYYYDEYAYEDEEISSSEYAQLGYQWYVGNSRSAAPAASTFTALEGATARELKLTSDLTGKYVACRVTYGDGAGDYEFTASLKNPVEALAEPEAPKSDEAKKLDEAVAKLKADGYSGWYPNPSQGSDANICSMLSAKLANLGYSDIKVSLAGVTYGGRDPKQDGGIADDGKISYFFLSPADKTSALDYSLLRQFTPTYTLTLGSERVSYTPGRASTLAWDGGKVVAYLKAAWAHVEGLPDEIEADVSQGTLPSSISINGVKVASISWMSLNGSVAKVNSGYGDPTVTYTHGMTDQAAQLTATLSLAVPGYNNAPSNGTAYLVSYTVKAKTQEQIDAEKAELSAALDRIVLKDFESEKEIDANAVEGDIQLPNTRRSGIDGPSGAKLSYASSNETVAKINGYRVVITRDIEGATNDAVITATLAKDGITVTRDIAIKVKPIADSEIDQAAAFMQQVKDAYAKSLLGANASVDAITENLSTFAEAVPTADGGIEYRKGKDSKQSGVVTADLPGYDAMSGNDWRTYRTSDTAVISNENLKVTRPEADTLVTVESNLTYAKYESLAKAHPENAKLQSLVNQSVKATYRVVGTVDHSDPKISVGFKLVGVDADGNDEVWADSTKSVVYGSTAGDVIEDALKGMTHTATGVGTADYYLSDITSADGRKLGWDASTGRYWQLFVNGKASEVGAGQVRLAPGDSVVLYYSAFGASPDDANKATVKASVSFIGPDENGGNSVWAFAGDVKMSDGSTAADLTEQELKAAGLTYDSQDTSGASFYLASITRNGKTYGSDQSTGRYWQLYVNGEYSQKMAGQITLKPGDKVQWVYAADNEKPLEGLIVNPFASRPDWTASWNGFGNAGGTTLVNTPTPTESAAELWKVNLATAADKWVSLGDPIIAGGYVFVTTNSELVKIDNTGKVVARVSKGGTTSYFSRPVYADGLIISANDDGSVCAFSAETLECVWKTSALETPAAGGRYQANSTMTVANGCVYAEFVTGAGVSGTAAGGAMVCIDIATGKLVWSEVTTKTGSSTGEGYYWAGAAASGSDLVIGDESGCVKLIDGKSGKVKSSVSLSGNPVRATIVSAGTEGGNPVFLAIGRQPATLYKIVREGDALRLAGSCEFAKVSTSTPAVANGKVYVGGSDSSNNGQFTVVDLASMKVEKTLDMGKKAEVKASPIASVQGSDVYVYFTCNKTPGAVYCFNQSTGEAVEIYTPSGSNANYCTASVIADVQGNLYYTNDSGTLFALKAAPGYTVAFDTRGGSTVPSAMTAQNKTMVAPANPERSGYTFAGWYKDVDCTQAWDFSKDVVTADMTLYAKWTKNAVNPGGNGGSGSNGGSGNAGAGSGSGSGTNGQQSGGAVAPGQTPVSTTTTTETKDGKDSKKDSDKSDKKSDKKDGKSDKSDAGSSAATAAKKSTAAPAQESGFNPLAIVGVAAGVIGLAVIGVFVLTKRR